ncbi:MAG: hypothetical protein ACJ746_24725 [Bryobacteraceae bacterium]
MRTFLSPNDLLGFEISDYIELFAIIALALAIAVCALAPRWGKRIRPESRWWLLVFAALPIGLRLCLLPRSPAPIPSGADDFSYILLADTLRHFRLSNPAHDFPEFFEQVFVLQERTRSSMYPLGQGLILAFGWLVFGHPWAGVLLSVGAFCGACYWMLRAWISPSWALAGGLLAVLEFGPLSYWTNSYWGGAVSASAGCLVFGALPRIANSRRLRNPALLGCGLSLQLLTRPFEFCFLVLSVPVFFFLTLPRPFDWTWARRAAIVVSVPLFGAFALTLLQNKRVTGNWATLPYMLYRYQYGMPATLTFQPNPIPHRALSEEQDLAYRAQSAIHGTEPETPKAYLERLIFRIRFLRFFLLPPLYVAVIASLSCIRNRRLAWILLTIGVFLLGSNFYPYFFPHYVAAIAGLFVLLSVIGIQRLDRATIGGRALPLPLGSLILLLCSVHFAFWFGVNGWATRYVRSALLPLEAWDYINYGDPQGRIAVRDELETLSGKKLVFVHYAPGHRFEEWVHNGAEIDAAPVVLVHDLGPIANSKLLTYYRDRTAWLLEPDQSPPRLTRYVPALTGFQTVQ